MVERLAVWPLSKNAEGSIPGSEWSFHVRPTGLLGVRYKVRLVQCEAIGPASDDAFFFFFEH